MPVINRSNNRILPANSRAVDVATKAIQEVTDVMQRRTHNALRVQGYPGILYTQLKSGVKCSCTNTNRGLKSRLDINGNASPQTINELLTGDVFRVRDLATRYEPSVHDLMTNPQGEFDKMLSPGNAVNPYDGYPTVRAVHGEDNVVGYSNMDGPAYGENGEVPDLDINEIMGGFDPGDMTTLDTACGCCFGTGFVGGFTPFKAARKVFQASDLELDNEAVLDVQARPWTSTGRGFTVKTVLPRGANALQAFKVWNNTKPVPILGSVKIDGRAIRPPQLLAFCDGAPHTLEIDFGAEAVFTHFEIQFNLGDGTWFDFPKTTKSNNLALNPFEPFQVLMGPDVPVVNIRDILVESTTNKVLVVESTPIWNTRSRQGLGWEVSMRVTQPMEVFNLLPVLGRLPTKNRTTNMVIDNLKGHRV